MILVIAGGIAGFIWYQRTFPSTNSGENEIDRLTQEIGRFYVLPVGETPTLSTVSDQNKLTDQVFFEKAKNGDKVLIYSQAKKAILYDPQAKKILEIAPIADSQPQPTPETSPISSQTAAPAAKLTAKIVLRNGTKVVGLASKTRTALKEDFPDINVVKLDNAHEDSYEDTIIVLLDKESKADADILAKNLGAKLGELPDKETEPTNADILVIIGSDQDK